MKEEGGKNIYFLLILLIAAGFFIFPKIVLADNQVVINEIMISQKINSKNEFIKLYNASESSINLEKFKLYKKTKSGTESCMVSSAKFIGIIPAHGYFIIAHPDYASAINADLSYSSSSYSIADDSTVILYDREGKIVDKVGFGNAADFERKATVNPPEDKSIVRKKPGKDSDNNFDDFTLKGDELIEEPEPNEYSSQLRINEILPNPEKNKGEEFIEIYNYGNEKIDLKNWILRDGSKTGKFIFPKESIIEPEDFFVICKKDFNFALNNSGNEDVFLLSPDEKEVDKISYSGSKKGVSYNYSVASWRWSRFLTPGAENKFNNLPSKKIKIEKKIYKNMLAEFQVKAEDKDRDELKFTWDFGDGHKSYLQNTSHKYEKAGIYQVSLKILDGSEEILETFKINVENFPDSKINIVGVKANPKGKDNDLEIIKIKNNSKKKINLKGWSIATGWKELYNHPINKKFVIKPGETKELTRKYSAFSLNNKQTKIELRYPDGTVAAKVKYSKKEGIEDDEVYEKTSDGWEWISAPSNEKEVSSGAENIQNKNDSEQINRGIGKTETLAEEQEKVKSGILDQEDEPVESDNTEREEVLGAWDYRETKSDNQKGAFYKIFWKTNKIMNNIINFFFS